MRQGKTRADQLRALERREYVLSLRRAGARYRDIAQQVVNRFGAENLPLHYDERYACDDVMTALSRQKERTAEAAESVREMELQRLDEMFLHLWPLARRRQEDGGPDLKAMDRLLRIMEHRARLIPGLSAPTETRHGGRVVLGLDGLDDDELDALYGLLRKAEASGEAVGGPSRAGERGDGEGEAEAGLVHGGDEPPVPD